MYSTLKSLQMSRETYPPTLIQEFNLYAFYPFYKPFMAGIITYDNQQFATYGELAEYLVNRFAHIRDYLVFSGFTAEDLASDIELEASEGVGVGKYWSDENELVEDMIERYSTEYQTKIKEWALADEALERNLN